MRDAFWLMALGLVLAGSVHHAKADDRAAAAVAAAPGIAWRDGDVEDAFAEAREKSKPVLLYWGARWCPPCNLMKQTLFKDPTFIAETRNFIPVHLDGDAKDAQSWGARFGIQGYPTVIVLMPDRTEITRLSGGSMASTLTDVLRIAAERTISTEELLRRTAHPASLTGDDWRLLANFDWFDDPRHFGDPVKEAALLSRLADAAPDPAIRRHLFLVGVLIANGDAPVARLTPDQQNRLRTTLAAILGDYGEVKANRQELSEGVVPMILALSDRAERRTLSDRLVAALDRLAADPAVPLGDRLATTDAEIALSRATNGGKVTPDVIARLRDRVAMADRTATNPSMRQAVMPEAGQLFAEAGKDEDARRIWEAELPHALAPYYDMADLADLAETDKDPKMAMTWLERAAETAQGPATRIQWALLYSNGVMRMAPDDKPKVAQSAGLVIDALGANDSGYAERTEKRVGAWSAALRDWSAKHDGAALLAQLSAELDKSCAPKRCKNVLKT